MQSPQLRPLLEWQGRSRERACQGVLAVGDHPDRDGYVVLEALEARARVRERGVELGRPVMERYHRELGEELGRGREVLVDAAPGESGALADGRGGHRRDPSVQELLPRRGDERRPLALTVLHNRGGADAGHPPIIADGCYRHGVG